MICALRFSQAGLETHAKVGSALRSPPAFTSLPLRCVCRAAAPAAVCRVISVASLAKQKLSPYKYGNLMVERSLSLGMSWKHGAKEKRAAELWALWLCLSVPRNWQFFIAGIHFCSMDKWALRVSSWESSEPSNSMGCVRVSALSGLSTDIHTCLSCLVHEPWAAAHLWGCVGRVCDFYIS